MNHVHSIAVRNSLSVKILTYAPVRSPAPRQCSTQAGGQELGCPAGGKGKNLDRGFCQ